MCNRICGWIAKFFLFLFELKFNIIEKNWKKKEKGKEKTCGRMSFKKEFTNNTLLWEFLLYFIPFFLFDVRAFLFVRCGERREKI